MFQVNSLITQNGIIISFDRKADEKNELILEQGGRANDRTGGGEGGV